MESRDGSTTPNSMAVLDRGAGGISTVVGPSTSSRPPSGRRSRNMTPIQRSGSQLEVLPPDDKPNKDRSGSRTSSRTSHHPSSRSDSADNNSPRQTQSAGSSGRRSRQGQEGHDAGFNRANSVDGLGSPTPGESRPGSTIHKQVSLTTVKRNYETHGIPKNESWDFVPEDVARITPPLTNGTSHTHVDKNKTLGATGGLPHEAEGVVGVGVNGGNGDGVHVLSEKERTEQRLNHLMEQLSMKDKEIKQHEERRKSGSASKRKDSLGKNKDPSSTMSNSYYVSTGGQAEMNPGNEPSTSKGASAGPPPFLEDSRDDKPDKTKMDDDEDEDEDEDDDEEEGPTAPIELMGEFLDSVMDEDYETADKLCKMILIYEPDNAECLQFKPLIEEMLKRLWHQQLYGSSSEDESGEEDDDDDDDEEDEEDDDEDEDSDEESSESDSSEESEDEEEETEEKTKSSSVVYPNSSDTSKLGAIR